MGLLDEINQASGRTYTCRFAAVRDSLAPDDQRDLDVAMTGPASNAAITKALTARGMEIGEGTVYRHRRGRCCCAG